MASSVFGVTVKAFGQTDTGRVRSGNEDTFLLVNLATGERWSGPPAADWAADERGFVLAVSDGMGGAAAGEVASAVCVEALYRGMIDDRREGEEEVERLRKVVERVSREVRSAASRADRRGMGATLTTVFVCGPTAYVAEVGDSRAYLLRRGHICQVTRDQSYVQMLVDAGAITPEAAEHSPKKNLIMQVMGQKEDLTVALNKLELRRGDRLLLCSDGLSNMLKDNQICDIASAPVDVASACAALIDHANQAGGEDNITVVLAEVGGEGLPEPDPAEVQKCDEAIDTLQEFKP
jgi:serine/threonine protein phosphatase PrpC